MAAPQELDPSSPMALWGVMLRFHRKAQGLSLDQLGGMIGYDASTISLIERSKLRPSENLPALCDKALGTKGSLAHLYEKLTTVSYAFPPWVRQWRDIERQATILRTYQNMVIPGLLQTEGYARALLQDDVAVSARLERQTVLFPEEAGKQPPVFRCLLDEGVLTRPVATPEVMREQLEHLLSVISPDLSVQVVPLASNPDLAGAFTLAILDDGTEVAYLVTAIQDQVITNHASISRAAGKFERIRVEALPQQMSIQVMKEAAERWN